jgi:hypothetical protein
MLRSAKGVGPYLEFLRTPEAKTVKTRVHIDLAATSAVHHADPVAGLQDLGATPPTWAKATSRQRRHPARWSCTVPLPWDPRAHNLFSKGVCPATTPRADRRRSREAINASVWVFGGGLEDQKASVVTTGGTVTDGPYPEAVGGFCVVEVASHEEALEWAAKTAVACRCAQEVREIMPDPELEAMLRQADSRR